MTDFLEHHVASARIIVFAFASGDTKHFEWGGTLGGLGVSYVLIRDSSHQWYANGVDGWGDFRASALRVNRIAEPYERTVALGLSTGSYGALLYAAHALLDQCIAISPVTGNGDDVRPDLPEAIRHRYIHGHPGMGDLKPLYRTRPRVYVRAFISDGTGCDVDFHMAARINADEIIKFPGHDHDKLGAYMRDQGIIRELLT